MARRLVHKSFLSDVQAAESVSGFQLPVDQYACCSFGAVFGLPLVKAGVAEAVLAANLLDWHAGFGLPQETDDLLFAVFACSQGHHFPG